MIRKETIAFQKLPHYTRDMTQTKPHRGGRKSRLDRHAREIAEQLAAGVPRRVIARRIGCDVVTLWRWLNRQLEEQKR